MNPLLEQLEKRIEEKRKELGSLESKLRILSAERDAAVSDLAGYEGALGAERRRNGIEGPQAATAIDKADMPSADDRFNKTTFVQNLIEKHSTGITAAEIWKAFTAAGHPTLRNYVYAILGRLHGKGKIVERKGKYYPKQTASE